PPPRTPGAPARHAAALLDLARPWRPGAAHRPALRGLPEPGPLSRRRVRPRADLGGGRPPVPARRVRVPPVAPDAGRPHQLAPPPHRRGDGRRDPPGGGRALPP